MTTYDVIITYTDIVQVDAETEEQAIAAVRAKIPPKVIAEIQIPKEIQIVEEKQNEAIQM
jgi:hypothetical protein